MKTILSRHWFILLSLVLLPGPVGWAQSGPGKALNLDGATGYAQAPNGVWFNGDFTVEGWVFARSYNNWSRLFDFANGPNTNNVFLALSAGTTGLPVFGVYTNNNGTPSIQSSTPLPLNQWVHLAATLNGTLGRIYLNGILVAAGTLNLPPNLVRTNNYIGRSNYAVDALANAVFDELRIWNVARSQGQIQAFMHRSLVGTEVGLMGYWRMDEGSGATLGDSSGHGQTATLFGGTTWSNSTAPLVASAGSALNFNAAASQSVSVLHQPSLNPYPLTVMTWFKAPASSMSGALVNKYVSSSLNGYQIFMSGGHLLGWYIRDSGNNVFSGGPMDAGPVNDGLWHHAAMTIDAAGGRLYLDGILRANLPWTGTAGPVATTQPLNLGLYPGDSFWNGQLDEVSLWHTNLSTAQIQAAMNRPLAGTEPGLIGYWRLDESSGTTTADNSGHGNTGTLNNAPGWVASGAPVVVSDPGYGLHFNGTSTYADMPGFANVIPTNEITIEFWQHADVAQNQSTLSVSPDTVTDRINVHVPWSDGSVYWDFGNINTAGRLSYTPSPTIVGTWQHFAFVASQSGNFMSIYQNGAQVALKTGMTPFTRAGQHLILGAIPNGVYFNGSLDEVRIWNVARSVTQISQNLNHSLIGNEAGLVAYYRLDEGTGTTLVDALGNGNGGTLINSPTWQLANEPFLVASLAAATLPATAVAGTSATLNGTVNPAGQPTSAWFQWGTTTSYGNTTPIFDPGTGSTNVPTSSVLSGLNPGATYHFRLAATNSTSSSFGADLTFTLPAQAPVVTSQPATSITSTSVVLNVTVAPHGADTTGWFQYGTTVSYGSTTSLTNISGTNLAAVAIGKSVSGLSPATLYHFQFIATNAAGTNFGGDSTFTTPTLVPVSAGVPTFSDASPSIVWGDYNNDGFLDVLMENNVVRNNGNGTFTTLTTGLPARLAYGAQVWLDFDNDGYLDILITGSRLHGDSDFITQLWHNNGDGTFTLVNNTGLPNLVQSSIAVGDFDNDGRQDLLMIGVDALTGDGPRRVIGIWHNNGDGTFSKLSNPELPPLDIGGVAAGDFDNDGFLDIIITGSDNPYGSPTTQVWHNNGNGSFSRVAVPGLSQVYNGSVAVADFNNDGYPDFILTGEDYVGQTPIFISQVWSNNANGHFTLDTQVSLPGIWQGTAKWGDVDNDGRPDILLCGPSAAGSQGQPTFPITQVWRNLGNGNFVDINTGLPGLLYAGAAWGDYNNDGRLDLLASGAGYPVSSSQAVLARNFVPAANTPPAAPANLQALGQGSGVLLTWDPGSDAETPTAGLSYNIRMGTTPGGINIVSPQADPATGFRRVAEIGNAQQRRIAVVTNLHSGTYYWSVQTIDTAFAGSSFAAEGQFTLTNGQPYAPTVTTLPASSVTTTSATMNATVDPRGGLTFAWFRYGATTNYDSATPATNSGAGFTVFPATAALGALVQGTTIHYQAVATNIGGSGYGQDLTFTLQPGVPFISSQFGGSIYPPTSALLNATLQSGGADTTAWFDYGIDSNYGLATPPANFSGTNTDPIPVSVLVSNLSVQTLYHFRMVASNVYGTTIAADSSFTTPALTQVGSRLPSPIDYENSVAWGDFNNDGFLDVLMANLVSSNNGNGTFSQIAVGLPARLAFGAQAWVDYDNDGLLDFLITGSPDFDTRGLPTQLTQLWHNDGNGAFTQVSGPGLPSIDNGSIAFGDFDNDGRLDILMIGRYGFTPFIVPQLLCGIWHNNGDGTFTQLSIPGLIGIDEGAVACGDFDNDGYLDFIVAGQDNNSTRRIQMWRNLGNGSFVQVSIPGLPSLDAPSIAVGDFNNDGHLDFLLSGSPGPVSQLWSNNWNGTFSLVPQSGLPGFFGGAAAWGDFDSDGKPDLLLSGATYVGNGGNPSGGFSQVWRNLGNGSFSNINTSLPSLTYSSAAWGDYANDGRLDVLLFGLLFNQPAPILAQNFSPATNTPPAAPAGLQASVSGSGVVMNWNAATDAETPSAGLSYNVRVGTAPGGINIVSPAANTTNGFRRLPQLGNSQEALISILTNLPAGTYYWSVQAIDTSFAGSPFAAESQFTIGGPEPVTGATGLVTSASSVINGTVNPNGHDTTAWFQWGTNATYASNGPLVFVSGTNTGPVALSLSLTGLSPLTQYSYRLTASNSVGQNYGSNRVFVTPNVLPPQINQISNQGDGAILLQFSGESALSYTLLASTNFVDWAPVTNLTADVNCMFQFTTDSTNYPARFFRVRRP